MIFCLLNNRTLNLNFSPPLGLGHRNQTDVRGSTGQNVLLERICLRKYFFYARTVAFLLSSVFKNGKIYISLLFALIFYKQSY